MARIIQFQGHSIVADKVLSVDPVDSHSTGSLACDWSYGFTVRFQGNSLNILMPQPRRYGYAGGPPREEYKAAADKMRSDFIQQLWHTA